MSVHHCMFLGNILKVSYSHPPHSMLPEPIGHPGRGGVSEDMINYDKCEVSGEPKGFR